MNKQQKQSGFTIIEVVLVLAIAGLIFLMVFIALPALQRSQRDTARKSDVGAVASGVASYTGNNTGAFPDTTSLASYVKNVSDNTTSVTVSTNPGAQTITPVDGTIEVVQSAVCGTTSPANLTLGTKRQFAVITQLESGGNAVFCQNN